MIPRLDDQVTVVSAPVTADDGHGNPVVDWGAATETVVAAAVTPDSRDRSNAEDITGQDTVISRMRLFLPAAAVMTFLDRVVWRGDIFEVDGDVELHTDRRARPHHREALLRRVQG